MLRRNPVRAKEIQNSRNRKVEKVRRIVDYRNKCLSEHPKADVSTAIAGVNERIEKLKVSDFVAIDATGRVLAVRINEKSRGRNHALTTVMSFDRTFPRIREAWI